jgi:hypothetical protein
MSEPEVMMPVICPECGRESLCSLTVAVAVDALLAGRPISLHADCHPREWEADFSEREQLQEYLGATCIRSTTTLPTNRPVHPRRATPPASRPAYSVFASPSHSKG